MFLQALSIKLHILIDEPDQHVFGIELMNIFFHKNWYLFWNQLQQIDGIVWVNIFDLLFQNLVFLNLFITCYRSVPQELLVLLFDRLIFLFHDVEQVFVYGLVLGKNHTVACIGYAFFDDVFFYAGVSLLKFSWLVGEKTAELGR